MDSEKGHLLVVDRDETSRARLANNLEQQGYQVSVALDETGALQVIEAEPIDVILVKLNPQEAAGIEAIEKLKSVEEVHRKPILLLAGAGDTETVEKCLASGADDYLREPYSPILLKARIEANLEKQRQRAQLRSLSVELAELCRRAEDLKVADAIANIILPLGTALSAEKDFNRLLDRIVIEAKSLSHADTGILYLETEEKKLKYAVLHSDSRQITWDGTAEIDLTLAEIPLYDKQTAQPNHSHVAAHVALTGSSVNVPDLYQVEKLDFSENKARDQKDNYRTRSCLTLPLKNKDSEILGVLQLVNAQNPTTGEIVPFSDSVQEILESLAAQASIALNNQLQLQREKKLLKGERDLEIGRMIQMDFLPETLPQPPGWEIAARFYPARQVAGDFYDAFTMTHGRIGIVIADVCDKGVGPAMFMALCRSLIRVLAQQTYSLNLLDALSDDKPKRGGSSAQSRRPGVGTLALQNSVKLTNNYIGNNHSRTNMFATMFFGVLDPATGKLYYINGGHELPAICGPNGIRERLKTTGPAVGMMPNIEFKIQETKLEPGEILFSYTDGVPEAHNPEGQLFSDERLLALLQEPPPSAEALLDRVETAVRSHIAGADQFDDITMLAVRWNPPDEA